jgi:stearoyl-CoA desaturase (delta-9 desaturase)
MRETIPESNWNKSQGINWPVFIYLFTSPFATVAALILYIYFNGVHWLEPVHLAVAFYLTGVGLTAGYHRYYSHKAYDAHPALQIFYLLCGAVILQQPVLQWANVHRFHHRYADTDLDPHNINQGFFHAHMGWIFQKTPLSTDTSMVPDLLANKYVMWQKKYYWWLALFLGVGISALVGATVGRPFGGVLWGFALRVVLQNQMAYSINSFAHTFGKQTYSKKFEARDNFLLALFSNGEGYHSFHHRFARDYRNGVRWYDFDPSKWFIRSMSWVGLTRNLHRTPKEKILGARLET